MGAALVISATMLAIAIGAFVVWQQRPVMFGRCQTKPVRIELGGPALAGMRARCPAFQQRQHRPTLLQNRHSQILTRFSRKFFGRVPYFTANAAGSYGRRYRDLATAPPHDAEVPYVITPHSGFSHASPHTGHSAPGEIGHSCRVWQRDKETPARAAEGLWGTWPSKEPSRSLQCSTQ
jgi:hypothetical protein